MLIELLLILAQRLQNEEFLSAARLDRSMQGTCCCKKVERHRLLNLAHIDIAGSDTRGFVCQLCSFRQGESKENLM